MVYTIEGFSQQVLVNFGCDANDAILLRWFVNWMATGKMETRTYRNESYYWIKYEHVIRELPILGITNPIALGNRLKKLCKKCILKFKLFGARQDQKTCYAINQKALLSLLTSSKMEKTADNDDVQDDSSVRFTQKCIKKLGSSKSEANSQKNNRSNQPKDNGSQTLVHPKVNLTLKKRVKLGSSKSEADHYTNNDHNTNSSNSNEPKTRNEISDYFSNEFVSSPFLQQIIHEFHNDSPHEPLTQDRINMFLQRHPGVDLTYLYKALHKARKECRNGRLLGYVHALYQNEWQPENNVSQDCSAALPDKFEAKPNPKREPLPPDDPQVWPTVQMLLQEHVKNRSSYNTWIEPLQLISIEGNVAKIATTNETQVYWLQEYYEDVLSEDIRAVLGADVPIQIEYVLSPQAQCAN